MTYIDAMHRDDVGITLQTSTPAVGIRNGHHSSRVANFSHCLVDLINKMPCREINNICFSVYGNNDIFHENLQVHNPIIFILVVSFLIIVSLYRFNILIKGME